MASFMGAYGGQTYALMRIVLGFTFLFHGTPKAVGLPLAATGSTRVYPLCRGSYRAGWRGPGHDRTDDRLGSLYL